MSLRTKLIAVFLGVGLVPLVTAMVISYQMTSREVRQQSSTIATTLAQTKAYAVKNYYEGLMTSLKDMAEVTSTTEALLAFSAQFEKIESTGTDHLSEKVLEKRNAVKNYYAKTFADAYLDKSGGHKIDVAPYFAKLDIATIIAQNDFIVDNDNPLGK